MKQLQIKDIEILINKQFEINWYNVFYNDVKDWKQDTDKTQWFQKYTTTEDKEEEFKEYLRIYFKKFFIKQMIEKKIGRFLLLYWLTLK